MSLSVARIVVLASLLVMVIWWAGCSGDRQSTAAPSPTPTAPTSGLSSDAAFFRLVTQTEPFGAYSLFPNAEAVTAGTLNGSTAHRPMVRVSLNPTAAGALQNGKLPPGARFPNGSVIFKDVRTSGGATTVYTVMYKDVTNPLASNGWLWAEYSQTGSVVYSITNRGGACTGCHSLEQGPQNDFVRTFERQRP